MAPAMSSKMSADNSTVSRAQAMARQSAADDIVRYGDIELDTRSHVARRGERILRLNRTGLLLLAFFIGRPEIAHSRSQIAEALWGERKCDERTIDVYIRRLRGALARGNEPNPVRTIRGVGYAFSYQGADPTERGRKVSLDRTSSRSSSGTRSGRRRALASTWRPVKPPLDG